MGSEEIDDENLRGGWKELKEVQRGGGTYMKLKVGVGLRELGTRPGEEAGRGQLWGRGCWGRGLERSRR